MLEKSGAQNITACENQGKQCELSDHWKSKKKLFFLKIRGDDTKKTKRLTEMQVLTKMFTTRVFNKTKVTQLFKPINYWENLANKQSN